MGTNRLSRGRAPELAAPGTSPNTADPTHRTKASDMYAFGVMTFEVRTDAFAWYRFVHSLRTGSYGATPIFRDD